MRLRMVIGVLLASTIVATPAAAASKRKSLFEVLFPKAHEQKLKRRKLLQEQAAAQTKPKKPVKVQTSKNYTYRVAKRIPIKLVAVPVEFASVEATNPVQPTEHIKITALTADIVKAGKMKLRAEAHLASAVSDYYAENQNYHWIEEKGQWNSRAEAALKVLSGAETYGLNASDYAVELNELPDDLDNVTLSRERINREVSMTTAVLRYAMDAKFGTVNPNLLSGYHDFPVHYEKSFDVLNRVMNSNILTHTLMFMHPTNEKFRALKSELARLSNVEDDVIELDEKTFIRPGKQHIELPNIIRAIEKRGSDELIAEYSELIKGYQGDIQYTKDIVPLVKAYQKEAGLGADGIIGRNTIRKLSGVSSDTKKEQIKLSMERLRWHPNQFGKRHVLINQPEYRARYIENGNEKLSMRVVVGKKSNQTNFFYDEIEKVVYNPYWGVPRSIIVNEFLPKSLSNPGYLDQQGYEIRKFSNGKKISSTAINWYDVDEHPKFGVRQLPGPKNALGNIKILFPNEHAIYMHDTPAKHLFKKDKRAFSHGCVRLHDPQAMAAAVLGVSKNTINARIKPGKNETEHLSARVPVYVSYYTAWPQEDGHIKYFVDMYGRDTHLLKAIKATQKARGLSISS